MAAPVNGTLSGSDRDPRADEARLSTMQQAEAVRPPAAPDPGSPRAPRVDGGPPVRRPAPPPVPEVTAAELGRRLWRRRYTLAAVAAFVMGAGALYVFVTPSTYESSVVIHVERRERGIASFQDPTALFQEGAPTEGELRVMTSRTLLDGVVAELGLDVEKGARELPVLGDAVARRWSGPGLAPAWPGLGRYGFGGEKLSLQRVEVSEPLLDAELTLTALEGGRYRVATEDGAVLAEGEVGKPASGATEDRTIALVVSELVARPGTEFTVVKHRREVVVDGLRRALTAAEQGRETGVVELTLQGHDPVLITRILDALAARYVKLTTDRTAAEAARSLTVLEAQLPVLKANVERSEQAMNTFQRKYGTVNLSLESQTILGRITEIERQIAESELRSVELEQRYGDRHPDLEVLRDTAKRLREQRMAMESRLGQLPDLELGSLRLTRESTVAQQLYVTVLNRAEDLRLVKAGWLGNARILERPWVPLRPIAPKQGVILVLALFLGLGAGVVVALFRDATRRGVVDPDALEAGAAVDVFATISRSATQRKLTRRAKRGPARALAVEAPGDAAVEDLRHLRTTVQYALRNAKSNIVGVTGLAPDDGKSFVSVNLAHLMAAAQGRTLLVDADLRRGGLHRFFAVSDRPGLAEVLGGTAELSAAVHATDTTGLDVLPAGALPRNPAELLAGERFQRVLAELGQRYAAVIVDTPPVLSVSDFSLVGRHAGVNLLVLRAGRHAVDEIAFALKRLGRGGVSVAGAVLNDLPRSLARYGRGFGSRRYSLEAPPPVEEQQASGSVH